MDLIQEAQNRGYRKGTAIRYVPHAIDFVEGDYFEIDDNGDVKAYTKPEHERNGFDDFRCDTLYESISKEWVEIVDLSQRSIEQKLIDDQHNVY